MVYSQHDATIDGATILKDAGAVTSSAAATVASAAAFYDVGAAGAFAMGRLIVDTTTCVVNDGTELYTIELQASTTSDFSTAYVVAQKKLGDASVTFNAVDTPPIARHVIYWDNVAHTSATLDTTIPMRYLRVYTRVAGDSPSINYTAALVPN